VHQCRKPHAGPPKPARGNPASRFPHHPDSDAPPHARPSRGFTPPPSALAVHRSITLSLHGSTSPPPKGRPIQEVHPCQQAPSCPTSRVRRSTSCPLLHPQEVTVDQNPLPGLPSDQPLMPVVASLRPFPLPSHPAPLIIRCIHVDALTAFPCMASPSRQSRVHSLPSRYADSPNWLPSRGRATVALTAPAWKRFHDT
jgi:hypothetical protein